MPCGSVAGKNAFVIHLLCILARQLVALNILIVISDFKEVISVAA